MAIGHWVLGIGQTGHWEEGPRRASAKQGIGQTGHWEEGPRRALGIGNNVLVGHCF